MKGVLAIDPGTASSAYVIWDGAEILHHGKVGNLELLMMLKHAIVDYAVIEQVESYGMAVGKEVFETVFWSGRFYQMLITNRNIGGILRTPRRAVKLHLCNSMKAKDSNIRQALIDRYGKPGTKAAPGVTYGLKADTWQAFGLAVQTWDEVTTDFAKQSGAYIMAKA